MRRPDRRTLLALAGSAVLAAFSVAAVPFSRGLFRAPRTPYDAGESAFIAAPAFLVLRRAESVIPKGAKVVVRSEPSDPTNDSYLHRFGVALLPGRLIVPAARWSVPTEPALVQEADYEVVVGRRPEAVGGRLLLEIPEGSIWRRR